MSSTTTTISSRTKTRYLNRNLPTISLHDFNNRIDAITSELVRACEDIGFFSIINHGITANEISAIFNESARFFSLPDTTKSLVPFSSVNNSGWEKNSQIRPSTGAADQKESYQMQFGTNMADKWLDDARLPGFRQSAREFMHKVQCVSEKLMICFARGLGFSDDYFVKIHDPNRPDCQSVCRLLHYFETPKTTKGEELHRAGAHSDWDLVTLLFQKHNEGGLEVCPGRESSTSFAHGDTWTKVPTPTTQNPDMIVCNIGDLLMSWSDDRFKSTFHRVKTPTDDDDYWGERYSIAFFNQPVKDCVIQGPLKKYDAVTGEEFTRNAMQRNYARLEAKRKEIAKGET